MIILGGEEYPVGAESLTWHDHGMSCAEEPRTVPRDIYPDLIIWHWTGGENSAATTYETLRQRNLGVSFCIDREGVIFQYLDPVIWDPRDTGGRMGRRSISIEGANYGFRRRGRPIPRRGRDRETDEERIHGVKTTVARFYEAQITSFAALTKALCLHLDVPMVFPREADGSIAYRELTTKEKRGFTGIIGHFHKTNWKLDPGFHLFRELDHLDRCHIRE